jgi:phytanoyl-CoA hydroxylase
MTPTALSENTLENTADSSTRIASQRPIPELAADFLRDGYVILPGLLSPAEVDVLRQDTSHIIDGGWENVEHPSDYFHDVLPETGEDVFHRVQYIFPKAPQNSLIKLLGHPFILELAQHLLGEDFVCAAEALVFKMPDNGREVAIHADADPFDPKLAPLIFNVDYYLDDSSVENGCLWVEPGTHKTAHEMPRERVFRGLDFDDMIPVPLKAGDVILHNVRLIHGSPRSQGGALRRTVYYEFQSLGELLKQGGPRPGFAPTDTFIRDRMRLLMKAIDERRNAPYAQDETPFDYQPPQNFVAQFNATWPAPDEDVNLRPALGYNKYI